MTWQVYVLPITLSPSLVLDKLKPGWKTWTRIYRVHTLRPLLSLVPHPLLWVLTSKCKRTSPSGSHGHFRVTWSFPGIPHCRGGEGLLFWRTDHGYLSTVGNEAKTRKGLSKVQKSTTQSSQPHLEAFLLSRRICMQISDPAFARNVGTVAWKEIQRDRVMGVDDC